VDFLRYSELGQSSQGIRMGSFLNHISFLSPYTRHYPMAIEENLKINSIESINNVQTAIENELINCKRSIYFTDTVENELKYLKGSYPTRRFYKLEETLFSETH